MNKSNFRWHIYYMQIDKRSLRLHRSVPWMVFLIIISVLSTPTYPTPAGNLLISLRLSRIGSVPQSCPTLCDPMNCSLPGFLVHHRLPELTQTHVHWIGDAIQPSHSLSFPFPPAFNLSQHQGLFQWISSSHQVAKVLEFQLQHRSFQWIFRTDFL